MAEEMKTLVEMLALYGGLWVANTLLGIYNSLNKGFKFSWKYFGAGVAKAGIGAVALLVGSAGLYALPSIFNGAGITVAPEVASAMSILGVIGVVGSGVVVYAKKFVTSVQTLFGTQPNVKLETKVDTKNPNKGVIVLDVEDMPKPPLRPNVEDEPRDEVK